MKVLQVVGYKNAGKTTLVCEIVRMLASEGITVGTLKRDDHGADPEPEGVDTRRMREAGASMTALVSAQRLMWVQEQSATLEQLLDAMRDGGVEAVIVEGFKTAAYPKLILPRGDEDAGLFRLDNIIGAVLRAPSLALEKEAAEMGIPIYRMQNEGFRPVLAAVRKWYNS